jgi:hypothetical protein
MRYNLSNIILYPLLTITKEKFFAKLGKDFDVDNEMPLVESRTQVGFLVFSGQEKNESPGTMFHVESIHSGTSTSYKVQVFDLIDEPVVVQAASESEK